MKFLLDTNVFIESSNSFYAQDFCPGFWDFLKQQFDNKQSGSINKVYQELISQGDILTTWIKNSLEKSQFVDEANDSNVIGEYLKISDYINMSSQYYNYAKHEFLKPGVADPWLCAYASVHGITVVTQVESQS